MVRDNIHLELDTRDGKKRRMFKAHMQTTGGYINGETKVATTDDGVGDHATLLISRGEIGRTCNDLSPTHKWF